AVDELRADLQIAAERPAVHPRDPEARLLLEQAAGRPRGNEAELRELGRVPARPLGKLLLLVVVRDERDGVARIRGGSTHDAWSSLKNRSVSSGEQSSVPGVSRVAAAAAMPRRNAFSMGYPRTSPATNPPRKLSPAPTELRASRTGGRREH